MSVAESAAHPSAESSITAGELLDSARAMVPELRERAAEFDELRHLPADVADRMARAGFHRVCTPVGAGGLGLGPRAMAEASEILAGGAGSAAWCGFIAATSHLNMAGSSAAFRARAQSDPALTVAGVFKPSGTARPEQRDGVDGWVVDGRWAWTSGCRNSSWISLSVVEVDDDGSPVERSSLQAGWFAADEVEILDTWHVTGMRGTGSNDVAVNGVWLPRDRAIVSHKRGPWVHEPVFTFPFFGLLAVSIGTIALGMAQASLDEVAAVAATKVPTGSSRPLQARSLVHFQYATAQTELRAARTLVYDLVDDLWAKAQHGERATVDERAALRSAIWHAAHTSSSVIDQAFRIAGGSSVYESSPLQRHRRDVHVAVQHVMTADPIMESAGRVMLGVDDSAPAL